MLRSNRGFLGRSLGPAGRSMRICWARLGSRGLRLHGLGHGLRQAHDEQGASAGRVLRRYLAAVRVEHPLHDGQAETGACLASATSALGAPKTIEDVLLVRARKSRPVVTHVERDSLLV